MGGGRHGGRRAAPARRSAATAKPRRDRRTGSPVAGRGRPGPHGRRRRLRLAGALGAARLRQDDDRAAAGAHDLGEGFEPDHFDGLDFPELGRLRRLKELLVLLKGNDVLVHADTNFRSYPEGEERRIPGVSFETQLIIAFAPPDDSDDVCVTVDNGRSIPAGTVPFPSSDPKGGSG